jgi:hypothetical protein
MLRKISICGICGWKWSWSPRQFTYSGFFGVSVPER